MPPEITSPKSAMMPLLETRFFLPSLPPTWIPRPRLIETLKMGLHFPVILVSAPPGFGKSSILVDFIQGRADLKTGWLSVEPSDGEWSLFFRYLVAAWQRIFPQAGSSALAELNASSSPNREGLVNQLLNDLLAGQEQAGESHALLILDDYHRIETPAIHETVAYLVEHLPLRCHLALITRADPPLPVARWRSRGLLLELRADHLRFSEVEAGRYLNQSMHLSLPEEQVEILQERTEGWIAGLQMAALAIQGLSFQGSADPRLFVRDFGGSNRFVIDYLVEEVVRLQPEEIQQFLLATAFFEQFCSPLCDAVLGTAMPASQRILERLEKANLFLIALDDHRYWFRYHHLFAELLRVRLQQTHPERIPILYRRAAEWFAQNGLWHEAVLVATRYSALTADFEFGADLFEQAILEGGWGFLYSGMQDLIHPFPPGLIQARPLLGLPKTIALFERSQLDGIKPLAHFAAKGIEAMPPFKNQDEILGWAYVIQANIAVLLGDSAWALEASRQVARWIPNHVAANIDAQMQVGIIPYYEGDLNQIDSCWQKALNLSLAHHHIYYIGCCLDSLGRLCCHRGELNRAETLFQRSLAMQVEEPDWSMRWLGAAQRDYSDLLRERNLLDDACQMAAMGLERCETWDRRSGFGLACLHLGRILLARGDLSGANALQVKIDELRRQYTIYPDLEALVAVFHSQLCLAAGDLDQAGRILETCLGSDCCKHELHREWVLAAQANLAVHTGRPVAALDLIQGRLEGAKSTGRGRNWLEMTLITALAKCATGDRPAALLALGEGLEFAQAQGFVRIFIDQGEPMRALLENFRAQNPLTTLSAYGSRILAQFPSRSAADPGVPRKIDGMYETLTRRELEILRLICQGLSNQEIANRLVLSVGTVKSHTHNILGKLDVRDRPQAIAKAVQLGLN